MSSGQLLALAAVGVAVGLVLLGRGMLAYLAAARLAGVATSSIASAAIGEARVTGTVEPAELALVSPLRSNRCVYYRAKVTEHAARESRTVLHDERAVGFRVRDATGSLRVFPRGARFDVPVRYDEATGLMGGEPTGLQLRRGPAVEPGQESPAEQAAELLTVRRPSDDLFASLVGTTLGSEPGGRRQYEEAWIALGETVTVLGRVQTFDQLPDPSGADLGASDDLAATDPEVAADLAAARASGTLAADPDAAWGNAAIPGFGIGRPTRAPALDPAADPEPVVAPSEARAIERRFDLAPDSLVLAAGPDAPLTIALGAPAAAVERQESRFLVGLLGAVLAIASATFGGAVLSGLVR